MGKLVRFQMPDGSWNAINFLDSFTDEQIAAAVERVINPPKPQQQWTLPGPPEEAAPMHPGGAMSPARARSGAAPTRQPRVLRSVDDAMRARQPTWGFDGSR